MKLVPSDHISEEDWTFQRILNVYPLLKYRLTFLLNGYRDLVKMSFEAMQQGETDTADGWKSLAKKDNVARRLDLPLFETIQAWAEADLAFQQLRDSLDKEDM